MGSLQEGARNAVVTCMGVNKGERVLIVTDKSQLKIGNALREVSEKIAGNGKVRMFVLEDEASRPLKGLPQSIDGSILNADVTFWAAQSLPGELAARHRFIYLAKNTRDTDTCQT